MKAFWNKINEKLPWIIILSAFLWASWTIALRRADRVQPGQITLRIGHWQLESGVRQGLDAMAAEYQKIHPHVRIVQDAIPESTWRQWASTQLMGGTAPDLMEVGNMEENLITSFYMRYYLPLTAYVDKPNPYNKGTSLEGVPLMKTFKDGMRRSYVEETQEFMNFQLSMVGIRLLYNRDLLKSLTGLDEPPTDYREFIRVCEVISSKKNEQGFPYIPISSSGWHFGRWESALPKPLTYPLLRQIDFNYDGRFSKDEMYIGVASNRINLKHPALVANFKMVSELSRFFPQGYTGLNRDEAIFPFAQQKAVFIPAGVYEVVGLQDQAAGKFRVGVAPFPQPTKNDPEYGSIFEAKPYENIEGGFPIAINRTTKHPEVALDFLMFLTSQKGNEALNRWFGWIPIIQGTQILPEIEKFQPNLEGTFFAFDPNLGGETTVKWKQIYSLFQVHQISLDEMLAEFEAFYRSNGREDYEEFVRNKYRGMMRDEQIATGIRAKALAPDTTEDQRQSHWIKYDTVMYTRIISRDAETRRLNEILKTTAERPPGASLMEYTETAVARIKADLNKTTPKP